jgi:hypothetical protein
MTRPQPLSRPPPRRQPSGLADVVLDVALPTMAALLTLGVFLLAAS